MKASISLDKERIKLKGNRQKVIIHIHPSQDEPWTEPIDEEVNVRQLYQIQNNEDYTEPNIYGEFHLGNPNSIWYNLDVELYERGMKIYEIQEREFWIIQAISKNKTRQCLFVYIIPTIFQ